jgi:hypothetical protein
MEILVALIVIVLSVLIAISFIFFVASISSFFDRNINFKESIIWVILSATVCLASFSMACAIGDNHLHRTIYQDEIKKKYTRNDVDISCEYFNMNLFRLKTESTCQAIFFVKQSNGIYDLHEVTTRIQTYNEEVSFTHKLNITKGN